MQSLHTICDRCNPLPLVVVGMQPTKYPLKATLSLPVAVPADSPFIRGLAPMECSGARSTPLYEQGRHAERSPAAMAAGCEAPLDLIEEHLTYESGSPQYRRGSHGGVLLKNWFFPDDWTGPDGKKDNFILKVQPFQKGGYEATVRQVDLVNIGEAMLRDRKLGKREIPDEISQENQQKAACRAKREMRYKVRNMMADHLVTFTKREAEGSIYWAPEQWAIAWDKFRRNMEKVMPGFQYVGILEKHEKGNYHLHVAWCGRVNVGIVRKLWLLAIGGGKGCGNIDAKHIKVQSGGDRSTRIARYISKYVSKHFIDSPRYNKKRYWASRQTLEEARRYVLKADTLDGAIEQMRRMLGLDFGKFNVVGRGGLRVENLFLFPDGGGLWLNYIPELHGVEPPF